MEAVGAYRRCFALRETRQRAGRRGAQTGQFDLPGGPRDPDAAGGAEQRTVLAETECGSPDEMRGISHLERGPGAEHPVLFGGDSLAAALHLQGSTGDFAKGAERFDRADAA